MPSLLGFRGTLRYVRIGRITPSIYAWVCSLLFTLFQSPRHISVFHVLPLCAPLPSSPPLLPSPPPLPSSPPLLPSPPPLPSSPPLLPLPSSYSPPPTPSSPPPTPSSPPLLPLPSSYSPLPSSLLLSPPLLFSSQLTHTNISDHDYNLSTKLSSKITKQVL